MSLHAKTYSLNALSVELGHDRRTLGRWLKNLPPTERGRDKAPRWRMLDVVEHLKKRTEEVNRPSQGDDLREWLAHQFVPTILGSSAFCSVFLRALHYEIGLSKEQSLHAYQFVLLGVVAELERAGINCGMALPPLAEELARDGVAAVAARWPDSDVAVPSKPTTKEI